MSRPMGKPQWGALTDPITLAAGMRWPQRYGLNRIAGKAKTPLMGLAALPTITQGLA